MIRGAEFSDCRNFRFALWRIWDDSKPMAMCIGLNPSTANGETDDNTIRKLIKLIENNGYGGFYMMNLFAFITPYPGDLRSCPNPIHDNDIWLRKTRQLCTDTIYCWGNFKQAEFRAKIVKDMFSEFPAFCFGQNANGSPKHPLYLKSNTKVVSYEQ